ncbi:hypothetical protein LXL04_012042 [Taraxacum kok-saghyz]
MTFQRAILISMAVITLVASISRVFTGKMMDVFISLSPFSALIRLIVINIHSVFDMVSATEARKLVVQTFAYVILKGAFASLVVLPTLYQARLWSAWMILILFQKMFLYVTKIRLQRLMKTSPSATHWSDVRIDSAFDMYFSLLAILAANVYWMNVLTMYQTLDPSTKCFLIFYEPLSITFETLHALLVHGFQMLDIWLHYTPHNNTTNSKTLKLLDTAAGKTYSMIFIIILHVILRDVGFFLDIMIYVMYVGHFVHIWWLHGMTFHLVDAMLFLPILSLLMAVVNRTWKYVIELIMACPTLPDAAYILTLKIVNYKFPPSGYYAMQRLAYINIRLSTMTHQRVNSISIAMIIMVVSAIVFRISQVSRVFVDIQWQWGRNAMSVFVPIAPFTAMVSLLVINSHVVFLMAPATEARKLVVETFKYLVYKGAFLPFVVPATHYQARLWSGWMVVIFCLKMFLAVAKNRIHLLNASPSATPWSYFRFNFAALTYFFLLVLLIVNAYWMCVQMKFQTLQPSPVSFLLLFEPLSIAFETLNAILVQGFQLIDIWLHSSPRNTTNSIISELLDLAVYFGNGK